MTPGAMMRRWRLLPALLPLLAAASAASAASAAPAVTFNRDVAPILQANCQECHRPGEIGPFPLLTYQDAREKGELIKVYTQERIMPPSRFGSLARILGVTADVAGRFLGGAVCISVSGAKRGRKACPRADVA